MSFMTIDEVDGVNLIPSQVCLFVLISLSLLSFLNKMLTELLLQKILMIVFLQLDDACFFVRFEKRFELRIVSLGCMQNFF